MRMLLALMKYDGNASVRLSESAVNRGAARAYHPDRARRHWITKSTTHIEAMAETRPRPRRAGSKDERITASASRKKPPTRLEAGWLASWIVGGSGLIRYVATGLIGAFVGGYLLEKLGIDLGIKNPLA